jgi:hypothetical protein
MVEKATKPIATPGAKKTVSHIAYSVRDAGDKNYWDRIGAAFAHKNGGGFDALLDAVPLNGRITLIVPSEKPAEDTAEREAA